MKWLIPLCLCGLPLAAPAQTFEEKAVAAVLMAEAWSEGMPGMTAVAEVIHQRAVEKAQAPLQVVSAARGQFHAFSCLNGTTLERLVGRFDGIPDYQRALQLAQTVCQTPALLPGLAKSANHYTRATEHPYWSKGKRPVAVIGTPFTS